MTVTTNEYGQNNLFAKEPQMVVESYNRKGLESPQQYAETYNGRWAMMGIILLHFCPLLANFSLVSSEVITMFNEKAEKLNGRSNGWIPCAVGSYLATGQVIPGVVNDMLVI